MSVQQVSGALVLTLMAGAASCKSEAPPTNTTTAPLTPATPQPATRAEALQTPTVHAHMAEHYAQADRMKRSVINGDLATYRQAATWLAEHELSSTAPEPWRERARVMQDAAKGGRDAQNVAEAATALGGVGAACAACHTELGRPNVVPGEPPALGSGAQPHMARHQWAADRLWDGLIVPSDEIWIRGAEVMADAPLEPGAVAAGRSVDPEVARLASSVHEQASVARLLPRAERGAAYAKFVQSCSECHAASRISPK